MGRAARVGARLSQDGGHLRRLVAGRYLQRQRHVQQQVRARHALRLGPPVQRGALGERGCLRRARGKRSERRRLAPGAAVRPRLPTPSCVRLYTRAFACPAEQGPSVRGRRAGRRALRPDGRLCRQRVGAHLARRPQRHRLQLRLLARARHRVRLPRRPQPGALRCAGCRRGGHAHALAQGSGAGVGAVEQRELRPWRRPAVR